MEESDRLKEKISNPEDTLEKLSEADSELGFMREISEHDAGDGKLSKVPVVVKDSICVEGETTSAGSSIIENYSPVFSATVVERLKREGARYIGKTNMDEFGFGTFCTNCAFGTPRNPQDPERVVGGSSGGAGAAVAAADQPIVSIGESTGGSISNPAAYNGVVGVTPTYGRVSRYGLVSYANSLDKIGVLTKRVEEAAEALEVIAGEDPRDQTTAEEPVPAYFQNLEKREDLRIGVPKQYSELEGLQEDVRTNFESSLELLERIGEVEEVDMPLLSADYALPSYYVLAMAEASTNLAKYSGMRYGAEKDPEEFADYDDYFSVVRTEKLGPEAKRRILLGTYTRMAGYRDDYYIKAAKVRTKIIEQFVEAFSQFDVLVSPTMPNIAPKIEDARSLNPAEVYAMDTLTVGPNLAGLPMASVPNGTSKGMPTGLHIIGDHFAEQTVLDAAYTFQELRGGEE